jgi:CobQ-like glutamine amidotransferase family enzyme
MMSADSTIGIAVLLPDLLGTYSDVGNATVLAQRLRWRGLAARIIEVPSVGTPPTTCDLYVLGGGEDTAQIAAARWLSSHRALVGTLSDRAVTLAVCAGLQLLGHATTGTDGLVRPGLGLLDLTTRPGVRRAVGESVAVSTLAGVGVLTGFHNHRGTSVLGSSANPLGHVASGPANHPATDGEGALSGFGGRADRGPGVVATYLHGPVLARNPALADHLLARVVGHPLADLDPDRLTDLPALRRSYLGTP